jgi:hypothetical protein
MSFELFAPVYCRSWQETGAQFGIPDCEVRVGAVGTIDSNVVIQCQLLFHEEKLNLLHWESIENQYRLGQFDLFVKKLEMDDRKEVNWARAG